MKTVFVTLLCAAAALFSSSCKSLDTSALGPADRVAAGVVSAGDEVSLPPGSEVWVRVIDLSRGEDRAEVLGEETIKNPPGLPAAFRIEYRAEDATLRGSIAIDARVSVGGKLRYLTTSRHPITPSNVAETHVIVVAPAAKP